MTPRSRAACATASRSRTPARMARRSSPAAYWRRERSTWPSRSTATPAAASVPSRAAPSARTWPNWATGWGRPTGAKA
ncbi:hypothetical protein G6F63_015652 [Rhizopus arrhizus]|uniref:Uncharacterized protein n=1 Tax=Rhizopus delemar TaxID=936053 RepID=A0A9P6XPN3_9FUNG|nr:hypothetical protein G6F31_020756 [Rhizopus arrhizus]KAG1063603.1 hypothetical protein G6F40_017894 [Rhizopus arrhizus]KAG1249086.1 hypothetical protein G6F65_019266 [Rhizopus arrhizus]KAG1317466.1 hypothetical protein G6F63_015652 [Rhizopus arrhizus]KAG1529915.1 hypothetical protein G6F50_017672 [Rhizopus delemar]